MAKKNELREQFKSILISRRNQAPEQRLQQSQKFAHQIELFFSKKKGSWGAFQPMNDEPPLLTGLSNMTHMDWYFPRIKNEVLEFSNARNLKASALGFLEPDGGDIKPINSIEGFLIPGLAFDRSGNRLGRGKGYYDRSLEKFKGQRVGICYSEQLVKKLEAIEPHDLVMDFIITENETVTCGSVLKGS